MEMQRTPPTLTALQKVEIEVEWEATEAADRTRKLFKAWRRTVVKGPSHWITATPLMAAETWNDLQPGEWLKPLEMSWRSYTGTKSRSELPAITWKVRPPAEKARPKVERSEYETMAAEPPRFPEVYRMPRCRKCPEHCIPCLTLEEVKGIQDARMEAGEVGEAWKTQKICQACHLKSNRKQNELLAEKAGHGKPKKGSKAAEIQKLLDALEACEKAGVVLSDEELAQLKAKMRELGIG